MTDIRIVQVAAEDAITLDFLLTPRGTLDDTQDLVTAVTVALCTDRLAKADDVLPDPDNPDRRGWWADLDAEEIWDGWPIGSRLWLLEREANLPSTARRGSTLARVEDYVREALAPFKAKGVASRIAVEASRNGTERIDVAVTLFRGPLPAIALRYAALWDGIGA